MKLLDDHFKNDRQMVFLVGPRQVGKTYASRAYGTDAAYFNWDNEKHRDIIISGPSAVIDSLGVGHSGTIIFDELHKFSGWQVFLKGFYDTYQQDGYRIIVTGSARLDVYRRGGDSLLGRHFTYRMHPLSVAECTLPGMHDALLRQPAPVCTDAWDALVRYGGFPEPFLKNTTRFYNRWKSMRKQLLLRQDVRELTQVHDIRQIELLADLLRGQAGQLMNFTSLGRKIRVSDQSVRSWLGILESVYYCFPVRPWSANINRSLLKEPKIYLWDWAQVADPGARAENMMASHLLKAVHWWQDTGFGEFGLHYLRTKDGREVDFIVTRDGAPWFLVEVKQSDKRPVSPHLSWFMERTGAEHAFQAAFNAAPATVDCFTNRRPVTVSMCSLLAQLV